MEKKKKKTFHTLKHIVKKGDNASYQHFLIFQQCLQKSSCSGSLKVGFV